MHTTGKTSFGIAVGCLLTRHHEGSELKKRALQCVKKLRKPGLSEERYSSYLGGRALLSALLQQNQIEGWVTPNPRFGYLELVDKDGQQFTDAFVNVSHSSGFIAGALARSPVGIDVEAVTRDASRVAERVSEPDEWKSLPEKIEVVGGSVPASLAVWCAKEAVSKALGLGVVFGMKAFRINFSNGNPAAVDVTVEAPLKIKHPAVWLEIRLGHLFAICTERDLLSERIRWYDESQIR